jgi:hypothetical protein
MAIAMRIGQWSNIPFLEQLLRAKLHFVGFQFNNHLIYWMYKAHGMKVDAFTGCSLEIGVAGSGNVDRLGACSVVGYFACRSQIVADEPDISLDVVLQHEAGRPA